jgi:hypothetical protein
MAQRRILALGAGTMGNIAAQTVASFPEVGDVIIADLDLSEYKPDPGGESRWKNR